jgi:oligopeptide/dipeptide ABC transporter ATP-binding protein
VTAVTRASADRPARPPEVLLDVSGLTVRFASPDGEIRAVEDVSFDIRRGESLGVVGESGSGKTVTCMSLTWLLPSPPARYVAGRITYDGRDLRRGDERALRSVRGSQIAMVFQNARAALDPAYRIGDQLHEVLAAHGRPRGPETRASIIDTLQSCNIGDPAAVLDRYPHQVSGGVAQRVTIAMALVVKPDILIADEPTTALDLLSQLEVLRLLERIRGEIGCSIVLVSHDLGIVRRIADRVLIMYAGRIVERGPTEAIFSDPHHPYTRALLASSQQRLQGGHLYELPGQPPDLAHLPLGCSFSPRCPNAFDRCHIEGPRPVVFAEDRDASCFLVEPANG